MLNRQEKSLGSCLNLSSSLLPPASDAQRVALAKDPLNLVFSAAMGPEMLLSKRSNEFKD